MNRKLLKQPFRKDAATEWICPICGIGLLRILEPTFHSFETVASICNKNHDAWDPDWIQYRFTTILKCTNDKCQDHVALTGTGGVDVEVVWYANDDPDQVYTDYFRPLYFEPPLRLFSIPPDCPLSVSEPLIESFRLVFCSPASAANFVRSSLECLLTELHVARYTRTNGKLKLKSLHHRIELLPSKYDELKKYLFAIKWLGNAGSHSFDKICFDDVMDAYELISHVLDELFLSRKKKASVLAKKVNKRKGPVK